MGWHIGYVPQGGKSEMKKPALRRAWSWVSKVFSGPAQRLVYHVNGS